MDRRLFASAVLPVLAAAAAWPGGPMRAHAQGRAGAAQLMNELMSGAAPVGGPFTLRDADGRAVRLADFRGKLVLLYFGYSGCADVCPTDLLEIGKLLSLLGSQAGQVQPIFITLDPARDTPGFIREYASAFHPAIVALRGTDAETREVALAYKVFYEKVPLPSGKGYTIDHTAFIYLLDRQGRYLAFMPPGTPAGRMRSMIRDNFGLIE
jgi:cytochrome oxidase Cu insertion factor (SCO1/SenC/PrrC family)